MSDRESLIRGYKAGCLFETIRNMTSADRSERSTLVYDLVELHNNNLIDLLKTFGTLTRETVDKSGFSLLLRIFEEALPDLEASVPKLIQTLVHLYHEAGKGLADGAIFGALENFLSKSSDRSQVALVEIEANASTLAELLIVTLIAGSMADPLLFANETIRLCGDANIEIRKRALFSLGRLKGELTHATNETIVSTLEHVVAVENDEEVLANALNSAFELSRRTAAHQSRFLPIIADALAKGGDLTMHAAAQFFGFNTREISPELLEVLLDRLAGVKPTLMVTLESIDSGIAHLLQNHSLDAGLGLLEKLLLAYPEHVDLSIFDDTARTICHNPVLRSKVATRWLLRGTRPLCEGLDKIVDSHLNDSLELEADTSELAGAEPVRLLFAARKAIGYLFLQPVSATSFVLSLMRQAPDASIQAKLGDLLLNPLLLNFSAKLSKYLNGRAESEPAEVRAAVRRVLDALENYLEDLKSVGDLPALHPSLEHRFAFHRHMSEEVTRSFEKAQAESALLQLFPVSVLLYGRKAIHHAFGPQGEISRMETQLGSHGTNIEFPRMTIIDPQGLDYMLRVFRREQMDIMRG